MRKLFAFLIVVSVLFGVASAEIDLSNMTLNEIQEIYTQVSSVLYTEALINGVKIPIGRYTAGVDIPVGSYVITFEWDEFDQYAEKDHLITVYDANGNKDYNRSLYLKYPKTQVKVTLEDGEVLVLDSEVKRHSVTPTIQLLISFIVNQ